MTLRRRHSSPQSNPLAAREAFRGWFGLAPVQADVLAALFEAYPAPVPDNELAKLSGSTKGALSVHLVELRRALEPASLVRGDGGYALSDVGEEDCRLGLEHFVAQLSALLAGRDAA